MKRTVLFTILMIFCLSITACATDPNHLTDAQTSIFHSLNVTHTDRSIVVKADAYLNITDADFLIIDVSEEDTVSLTYTLTRNKGDITLSYRTPDDSTVLLADTEDKTYGEETITLQPGTTTFFLAGTDAAFQASFSVKDIDISKVKSINDTAPEL